LKENPGHPELLFDLGRIYFESRHDPVRARNVWEGGLRNMDRLPDKDSDENKFITEQLLASLAKLNADENHIDKAIALLERLKTVSPNPDEIQKWIDGVKKKGAR
jgi:hypothetical protein